MADTKTRNDMDTLLQVMERLRDPEGGCPWDVEQSYETIAPSTIEEAYEVVDAIERRDYPHLKEELGDLMFQVVFYAQLGKEDGHFTFAEIVQELTDKLLRRHPHVFPDGTPESRLDSETRLSEAAVKEQWESIKASERDNKGHRGVLSDVPATLPAMARAYKLQKRAARVGFDWPDANGVVAKLHEELDELKEAVDGGSQTEVEQELGDALFSLINLARHLKIEPETALRRCNRRFVDRFEHMESALEKENKSAAEADSEELEALWKAAKHSLKER